jgi:hypothetical protein
MSWQSSSKSRLHSEHFLLNYVRARDAAFISSADLELDLQTHPFFRPQHAAHLIVAVGIRHCPAFHAGSALVGQPTDFSRASQCGVQTAREKSATKFYGVTNPIVLPDHSGVRYYDNATLDGGHLLIMLNNAQWISEKPIFGAVHHGEDRRKLEFTNSKDRWYPTTSPSAFVTIVRKASQPTDDEMIAAIHAQFDCVLQRDATDAELGQYLPLLKSSIEIGGNVEGLRQLLVSVLLKSVFLFRLEFGSGESPRRNRATQNFQLRRRGTPTPRTQWPSRSDG